MQQTVNFYSLSVMPTLAQLKCAASPGGGCGPPRGMAARGGGGPVRVRGDVKLFYSAFLERELLKAPVPNEP